MKTSISRILKEYWGYDRFRPLQEEIILSVLDGKDTLALLPTGGGKSICFQVPAMAKEGFCLVISPLIALMKDQVFHLLKKGIKASAIYSGMTRREIELTLNNVLFDPGYKFLYVSPERLKTELFRANLPKMNLNLIAVDEAHCISQWGYDFRPPYIDIAELRPYFPDVPVLALTATATAEVVKDIQSKLCFGQENVLRKSFKRENLTYYVKKEEDKLPRVLHIIRSYTGSGIIYVRNRKKTREIAMSICHSGIRAEAYHAGLSPQERDRIQKNWMEDKTQVIVATNAFGMGIDKPDVRYVIHVDIPDSLEAYFQEAGRAGRDGNRALALLMYDDHDEQELETNFQMSFPTLETIRKIYQDIGNFFQVAVGTGENEAFPFDMDGLAAYCEIKPVVLYNALSFMEKAGLFYLSEAVKKKSQLHIRLHSDQFASFYRHYPFLGDFLKMLLRSYNGLLSGYIAINEEELARRMNTDAVAIGKMLKKLDEIEAADYIPATDRPLLYFLENRRETDYFHLLPDIYEERKQAARKRMESVKQYVTSSGRCRSRLLLHYFGESAEESCGFCDVCRNRKNESIKKAEFRQMVSAIYNRLDRGGVELKTLVLGLSSDFSEEKITRTIEVLLEEGRLRIDRHTSILNRCVPKERRS